MDEKKDKKLLIWVGAIVKNRQGKILLLRRVDSSSWAGGSWQLPGGKMEWGEKPEDTLHREIQEETSCTLLSDSKLLGMYTSTISTSQYAFHVLHIIYLSQITTPIKISEDHDQYGWFEYKEIKDLKLIPDLDKFISRYI